MTLLKPGDIILTRGAGLISKGIRFFTRRIGEPRTKVNHVGLIVEAGPTNQAVVVEALSRVKRHTLAKQYGGGKAQVAVYRPLNLSVEQLGTITQVAESHVGKKYGYVKIALHMADWVLLGAHVFRRLGRMGKYPICSWLVADSYKAAGLDFGVARNAASPDDIHDFVTSNPDKYEKIRGLQPLENA